MKTFSGDVSGNSGCRARSGSLTPLFGARYDNVRGAFSSRSDRTSAASCNDWKGVGLAKFVPPRRDDFCRKIWSIEGPPAQWSCWPTLPSVGTPVMSATMPPSCVFCPPWLPVESFPDVAVTQFTPSTMTMYFCSGVKGALSTGSVKLVVVALAFGRQLARPGAVPSG